MPIDPDVKVELDKLVAAVKTSSDTVAEFKTTQEGYIRRIAGGLFDEKVKTINPTPAPIVKKDEDVKPLPTDERITKLENELKAERENKDKAEKSAAIAAEVSKHNFADPAYAIEKIERLVTKETDGSYKATVTDVLPNTQEQITRKITVEEYTKRFASQNTWLIKKTVQGGLDQGAGGRQAGSGQGQKANTEGFAPKTLAEAMGSSSNPQQVLRFLTWKGENPEAYQKLLSESRQGRRR